MKTVLRVGALTLALVGLFAPRVEAQSYGALYLGAAKPVGDFGDYQDAGITFRGQAGYSLTIVDVHLQTGWTKFSAADDAEGAEDLNVYHAGAGARLGLGFIWVGANGAYFFGDGDNEFGFFPEVGLKIWRIEGVVDYRITGQKWLAARLGFRF